MARQKIDIPIHGIDRRFSERQRSPGLCQELINLEPTGPRDAPYWKRVPRSDEIRNAAGDPFRCDNQEGIVAFTWHTRNSVGKYSSYEGASLRRLVCLFDDGQLKVFDPEFGDGWEVVASKQYGLASDMFDGQFQPFNDALVMLVTINGEPGDIELLVDDIIVPFEFPEVPVIKQEAVTQGFYTSEELDGGIHDGLLRGTYFVVYALELNDGTFVKHTQPEPIKVINYADGANIGTGMLRFLFEGYDQLPEPDNLEFWEDNVRGVAVLLSGKNKLSQISGATDPLNDHDDGYKHARRIVTKDLYENLKFYKIGGFDFLNKEGKRADDLIIEFEDNDTDILSYQLANVDNFTHHTTRAKVLDVFNSRVMLAATQTEFTKPQINRYQGKYVRPSFDLSRPVSGRVGITFFGIARDDVFDFSFTNMSLVEWKCKDSVGTQKNSVIFDTSASTYSVTVSVNPNTGYYNASEDLTPFSITFTQDDFENSETGFHFKLTPDRVSFNESKLIDVKLAVEMEAAGSTYSIVGDVNQTFLQSATAIPLYQGTFTYPDRRAKNIIVHRYIDGETGLFPTNPFSISGFGNSDEQKLSRFDTQNISYANTGVFSHELKDDLYILDESVHFTGPGIQFIPNRLQVSEVNDPFAFIASRTNIIGRGSNQTITAFATNALPVSDGQFGQYPIYVFTEHSIYALEQSSDPLVAFARVSPVSTSHGCKSPQQITNSGQSIIFLYKDGVYALRGTQADPISQPINNYPGEKRVNFANSILSSRKRGEDDEIYLCDGELTYVYNLTYSRWFTTDKTRSYYASVNGGLYGIGADGHIFDEQSEVNGPVIYRLRMNPVHFNMPEMFKRLYSVYFRGNSSRHNMRVVGQNPRQQYSTTTTLLAIRSSSQLNFELELRGVLDRGDQYIEAFTAEVEPRYEHKDKVYS